MKFNSENRLTKKEEQALIMLAKKGNIEARDKVIENNLWFAEWFSLKIAAKKYGHKFSGQYRDDLVSCGFKGLLGTFKSYKKKRDTRFSTFSTFYIRKEINSFCKYIFNYGMSKKELNKNRGKFSVISLDSNSRFTGWKQPDMYIANRENLIDHRVNVEKDFEASKISEILKTTISNCLSQKEKKVVEMTFGLNGYKPHLFRETAETIGITKQAISLIIQKSINKIKTPKLEALYLELKNAA